MKLSIIIPVFNEQKTLEEIIKRVLKAPLPKDFKRELVVVDDGSTDKTLKILKDIKKSQSRVRNLEFVIISHSQNSGKGSAVRTGIENCTGEIILIQDADLEYNPQDYERLISKLMENKKSAVYGSRLMDYPLKLWGKDKTPLPLHWFGNKFLTLVTNLLFGSGLTDMETCYKLFWSSSVSGMKLKSNGFNIEPELTSKFLKKGIRIIEVPIKVKPRTNEQGKKIRWYHGFEAIATLVKYKFTD